MSISHVFYQPTTTIIPCQIFINPMKTNVIAISVTVHRSRWLVTIVLFLFTKLKSNLPDPRGTSMLGNFHHNTGCHCSTTRVLVTLRSIVVVVINIICSSSNIQITSFITQGLIRTGILQTSRCQFSTFCMVNVRGFSRLATDILKS
ncbi:hypothetical protein V8G54_031417 [Vigna mungo]|uniref:Uncharacterized protein n=1 Tax=Vigna mungo TaxID=3915 RepID=A0AAQ3RM58_VIGMU